MMPVLLLADDNRTTQKVVDLALQPHGVQVRLCSSLGELLSVASNEPADLVMVSSTLPGWEGPSMCASIRDRARQPDLPIIVSVGAFELSSEENRVRLGCDVLLSKPFETAVLVDAVKSLLKGKKATSKRETGVQQDPSLPDEPLEVGNPISNVSLELSIPVRSTPETRLVDLEERQCRSTLRPLERQTWKP